MPAAAAENPHRASLVGSARISPGSSTTGSFTVELESFQDLPTGIGEKIEGPEFNVGGYPWRLEVYPGGFQEEDERFLSLFLRYCGGRDGVQASAELTVTHSARASFHVFHRLERKKYARKRDLERDFVSSWGFRKSIKRSEIQGPGALTIVAEVTVFSNGLETTLETTPARAAVAVPPPSLGASLRQLLETGMLSDVALKAADDLSAVAAHKNILAIRSPVFAAMFSSAMAEASSSEVALEGVSGPVLRSLLHFLYMDQLADDVADDPVQIEGLLAAADRYECPRLLALCEQRLCASVTEESSVGLLVLSEQHHAAQLKEYCLEFISQRPAEVMATQGWQQLGTHPNLLQELFAQSNGIRKRPRDAAEDEASDKGALTREQVRGMKVSELRAACVKRGLESTGLKAALVARLEALLD